MCVGVAVRAVRDGGLKHSWHYYLMVSCIGNDRQLLLNSVQALPTS
jgi:hypothetical protein